MVSRQTTSAQPKPHQCTNSTRSFTTRLALSDHSQSTRHGFPCTVQSCKKTFLSEAALAAHRISSAHTNQNVQLNQPPTRVAVRQAALEPKPSDQTLPSRPLLPCTVPGCKRTFKTSPARSQHLGSDFHKDRATIITQHNILDAGALVTQGSSASPIRIARIATPMGTEITTSNTLEIGASVTMLASNNVVRHSEAVKTARPPQPSTSRTIKPPNPCPLFRWDTRWSAIPTAACGSTMIALKALIPTPENSSSTNVGKKFWTPDQKIAPEHNDLIHKRQAIVLDCEMVGVGLRGTTSELARLSAIDFLTGELLVDTLVRPQCEVTDWRTKWSGITAKMMEAAVASGNVVEGSSAARTELFNYMDSQTILVGHALHFDLNALGIRHNVTVDSSILAKTAVGKRVKKDWALKTLCKELLGITVQDNEKDGHDAVEDALAAREVVLWCLQHEKDLKTWGVKMRKEYYSNGKKNSNKQNPLRRVTAPQFVYDGDLYDDDSDGYEFRNLSLAEFNELCGYPEWYDNWSD